MLIEKLTIFGRLVLLLPSSLLLVTHFVPVPGLFTPFVSASASASTSAPASTPPK